jgi:hypothetical protein
VNWDLLLGILLGLVTSIIGNLLTPFTKPLWLRLTLLQRQSERAAIRERLQTLHKELEQINRRQAGSDRDLFLYLFKWVLGIFAVFVAAIACALVYLVQPPDITFVARQRLFTAALVCLIGSLGMSILVLMEARYLTVDGLRQRKEYLEREIAKLTGKLLV